MPGSRTSWNQSSVGDKERRGGRPRRSLDHPVGVSVAVGIQQRWRKHE